MRKLKLQMQMSLDGFVAGPNGEMDWMTFNWDDELKKCIDEITQSFDLILLGRNLAEGFIPTWTQRLAEDETAEDARKFVETPKIVFSETLENADWAHTELAKGESSQIIIELKNQTGGDIIAYGGGKFVSSLIKDNLIDEYNLFVNPVILGKGMTIFNDLEEKSNLQLVKSQAFDCGIALLRYEPKR